MAEEVGVMDPVGQQMGQTGKDWLRLADPILEPLAHPVKSGPTGGVVGREVRHQTEVAFADPRLWVVWVHLQRQMAVGRRAAGRRASGLELSFLAWGTWRVQRKELPTCLLQGYWW